MRNKILIIMITMMLTAISVSAESLFTLGATQEYVGAPRTLFGGVHARNVGDLITIVMEGTLSTTDTQTFSSTRESSTTDNFTKFLNNLFGIDWFKDTNKYGGENEVSTNTSTGRQLTFGDKVAVQVTQQMPNGNLLIQGKKILVNGNERIDMIVTGLVDPRWINVAGEVSSTHVANLQFAVSGRGPAARGQNEGILNRVIRYLF